MNKVSVLLPVSSGDSLQYFKKAVESILFQTYAEFELIISIDGKIKREVDDFINELEDSRIKILRNPINLGLAATLNRAIREFPSGIYFRMDADDISHKLRFEKTIEEFNKDKKLLLVGTECMEIDENGDEVFYKKMPSSENIKKWAFTRNPFIHPSVAFRKDFIEQVGYYNENLRKSQDYELWARAVIKGIKMDNIHEILLYFRITDNFWKKRRQFVNIKNELKVSFSLVKEFHGYSEIPKIIAKIVLRFMPVWFAKKVYKYMR